MESRLMTAYLLCAVIGGTVLVVQTILITVGAGSDGDADVDAGDLHDGDVHDVHDASHAHGADSFLKIFSFKTLVAFVTFFGLGGLASAKGGTAEAPSLLVALGAGAIALFLVAYLMGALSRLQSKGNIDLKNAVGKAARVYLQVPGERAGSGKVTVAVQGRKVEARAVTAGAAIPTGTEVRVVGVDDADTLEVLPLTPSS
jgi:membrane protein implicated in regulation of membrane protease activity